MKVAAILLDTWRELSQRRTLWIYFGIITLTLLGCALALATDAATGLLSSIRISGPEGTRNATLQGVITGVQVVVASLLYPAGILLSVFATAGLVPGMMEPGTIDLLLSKAISRPALFLSRCLGAILVAGAHLIYLVGGLGLLLGLRTGMFRFGFLASALVMALYFACLYAWLALMGTLLRSTGASIMAVAALFFVSLAVGAPHDNPQWMLLITSRVWRAMTRALVELLYHALPRTADFERMVAALITGEGMASWTPIVWSALSGSAALAVATLYFTRKDF
jgi:ABC-type transport system involved in multi-copper enzyme maturation permease subunit